MSELEAKLYYNGLPSKPRLIARTGLPWEASSDPQACTRLKELRVAGNHKISEVWQDDLAPKVKAILDQNNVDWSSIDIVRFGYGGEPSGNVIILIGVCRPKRNSTLLTYDAAIKVALECKELLEQCDIMDVDVELRESDIWGAQQS